MRAPNVPGFISGGSRLWVLQQVTVRRDLVTEFKYDHRGNVTTTIRHGDLFGR